MAEYVNLSSAKLATSIELSADPYTLIALKFPEPPLRTASRDYAEKDGAEIISQRYGNSVRTVGFEIEGADKDTALGYFQSIQDLLNAPDLVLEYKAHGATNLNYADVLVTKKATDINFVWVDHDIARITLTLECKPFWRGARRIIAPRSYGPTPAVVRVSEINILTDNQASVETDTSGFSVFNSATLARDTTKSFTGSASLEITTPGAVNFEGSSVKGVTSLQGTYAGQVRVKGTGNLSCWVRITYTDLSNDDGTYSSVTLDNTWQLVTPEVVVSDPAKTVLWAEILFRTDGTQAITYNVDALQVERRIISGDWSLPSAGILGDVDTPCTIEVAGVGADSIGSNLVIGASKNPMSEESFTPIKDFQKTTLAGAYNGKANDTEVDGSWTSLTGEDMNISGIAMETASKGVAVGNGGKIFTTATGWYSIIDISHGLTSQNLNDVTWAGGTTYFVCGDNGEILKSTDSGANWASQRSNISPSWAQNRDCRSIEAVSVDIVFVGQTGTGLVTKTTNGGTNWAVGINLGLGLVDDIDLAVVDANTLYICADYAMGDGAVWSSTDGGSSVGPRLLDLLSTRFFAIDAPSSSVVFVCGSSGTIYKTENNGTDWTAQATGFSVDFFNVKMQSSAIGWMCGASGTILYTDDGGDTWIIQPAGVSVNLNGIAVIDANNVNIGGDGYTMLDTDDGGITWEQLTASWALSEGHKGHYRVYAIIKKDASGAGSMRVSSGWAGGSFISNPAVAVVAGTDLQTVYLGEISIPATTMSPEAGATSVVVVEGRLDAGFETWSSDVFWLVPSDGEVVAVEAVATASAHIVIDSDENAVNKGATIVTWIGSPIMLRPGDNNIVICETAGIDDAVVTVKYDPLYLLPVA